MWLTEMRCLLWQRTMRNLATSTCRMIARRSGIHHRPGRIRQCGDLLSLRREHKRPPCPGPMRCGAAMHSGARTHFGAAMHYGEAMPFGEVTHFGVATRCGEAMPSGEAAFRAERNKNL